MLFTHILILKVKVYHSFQFRDLFSVEMGNSLEQYRASIGLNNSGPRSRRKQPDVFSAALTDLLKMVVVLQVLLAGLLVLQLHLFDQPWQPSLGYEEGGASVFFPLVGKVITDLKWVAIQKQQKFHKTLSSVLQVLEKLWEEEENGFFSASKKVTTSQIKDNLEDGLKLTRERSSGPNIHDASKITYTKQSDGTLLKKGRRRRSSTC